MQLASKERPARDLHASRYPENPVSVLHKGGADAKRRHSLVDTVVGGGLVLPVRGKKASRLPCVQQRCCAVSCMPTAQGACVSVVFAGCNRKVSGITWSPSVSPVLRSSVHARISGPNPYRHAEPSAGYS